MVTLKHKKEQMQVVKKLVFIGLTLLTLGCSKKLNSAMYAGGNYTQTSYKCADNSSSKIFCEFFHFENKNETTLGGLNINGVIFFPSDSGKFVFNILPGDYKLETGFPGKKWTIIEKFEILKGDSIVFRIYLEDDDRPLVD